MGVLRPRVISALLDLGSSIVNNSITLGGSKEIMNITSVSNMPDTSQLCSFHSQNPFVSGVLIFIKFLPVCDQKKL